jgi:hypothetical protein
VLTIGYDFATITQAAKVLFAPNQQLNFLS